MVRDDDRNTVHLGDFSNNGGEGKGVDLDQDGDSGDGEKWLFSGYSL